MNLFKSFYSETGSELKVFVIYMCMPVYACVYIFVHNSTALLIGTVETTRNLHIQILPLRTAARICIKKNKKK